MKRTPPVPSFLPPGLVAFRRRADARNDAARSVGEVAERIAAGLPLALRAVAGCDVSSVASSISPGKTPR